MATSARSFILLNLFICAILSGCHLFDRDKDFDYGRVEQSVYKNDFFGVSVRLPERWQVQTKAQLDSIRMGKPRAATRNEGIKASEINSATVLTVYKFKSDTFFDFNPTVSIFIEQIGPRSGTRSANDYLLNAGKMLKRSPMHYEVTDSITKEVIGGQLFYRLHAQIENNRFGISQDYFSTMLNGFSFNFILTSSNDDDWQQLRQIISTANFSAKE